VQAHHPHKAGLVLLERSLVRCPPDHWCQGCGLAGACLVAPASQEEGSGGNCGVTSEERVLGEDSVLVGTPEGAEWLSPRAPEELESAQSQRLACAPHNSAVKVDGATRREKACLPSL